MSNHHAIVYVTASRDAVVEHLEQLHKEMGELLVFTADTFSIGEVRQVISQAFQTPGSKDYRLLVIAANSIAPEAQQALLKILEEPPVTTRFALVLPDASTLLPTIRSRVLVESLPDTIPTANPLFQKFIEHTVPLRLEMIALIAKKKDDEAYQALFEGLTQYALLLPNDTTLPVRQVVASSLRYLRMRGSAKKMLWEELALTLPTAPTA
jgi:DNA polymerase III delta prime subunit